MGNTQQTQLKHESSGHLGDEHALQHFHATKSHLDSLVYSQSAKSGNLLYVWCQRDKAKVYNLEGEKLGETPLLMRDVPNAGHPGAMLSLSRVLRVMESDACGLPLD